MDGEPGRDLGGSHSGVPSSDRGGREGAPPGPGLPAWMGVAWVLGGIGIFLGGLDRLLSGRQVVAGVATCGGGMVLALSGVYLLWRRRSQRRGQDA